MTKPASFFSRVLRNLHWRLWQGPRGYGRPTPASVFDTEYASGRWDHFTDASEAPRYERLSALIGESGRALHLLDVGCGSGRLVGYLRRETVADYLGIDISVEGLARARALAPTWARFQTGDFETWRPAEKWDAIVFNECIGYMRDPPATLVAWMRELGPDGRVWVSYYRSGNYLAIWRRINERVNIVHHETVIGPQGHEWDIYELQPRVDPDSAT